MGVGNDISFHVCYASCGLFNGGMQIMELVRMILTPVQLVIKDFAADYRDMQNRAQGRKPPCVRCSDAVIYRCAESDHECKLFKRYTGDNGKDGNEE